MMKTAEMIDEVTSTEHSVTCVHSVHYMLKPYSQYCVGFDRATWPLDYIRQFWTILSRLTVTRIASIV